MRRLASLLLFCCLLGPAGLEASELDVGRMAEEAGSTRLLDGNSVELLDEGPVSLSERLKLVAGARHHLLISTFIWRDDEAGREMIEAIRKRIETRRKEGGKLRVLVIFDATTSVASLDIEARVRRSLKKAGALVRILHPWREGLQPFYMTRLHDKILIADGKVAIFGGRNYSDHYFRVLGDDVWYDADVRLEGPAVEDLQMHWLKMWCVLERLSRIDRFLAPPEKTLAGIRHFWKHGRFPDGSNPLEKFADRQWFPVQQVAGSRRTAVLYDNPMVWKKAPTVAVLEELIRQASNEVDLVTPFPNFPSEILEAMEAAVARGVRIRILTNSEKRALRDGPYWKVLLPAILRLSRAGVEFWGWEGAREEDETEIRDCRPEVMPFSGIHAKYLQVDGRIAIVSASNFNVRSGYYNTEAGVLVDDPVFARLIRNRFDRLIGALPFRLQCRDGEELHLEQPSQYFDEELQRRFEKELAGAERKFEAYGPVF